MFCCAFRVDFGQRLTHRRKRHSNLSGPAVTLQERLVAITQLFRVRKPCVLLFLTQPNSGNTPYRCDPITPILPNPSFDPISSSLAPDATFIQLIQYQAPDIVKVIGSLTFVTVPVLNRQRLNALRAELSSIGLPVLCPIMASVTLPLPGSTVRMQTPLPVICRLRASIGYSGLGAKIANAFAFDIDITPSLGGLN